jgi:hypothetical protein
MDIFGVLKVIAPPLAAPFILSSLETRLVARGAKGDPTVHWWDVTESPWRSKWSVTDHKRRARQATKRSSIPGGSKTWHQGQPSSFPLEGTRAKHSLTTYVYLSPSVFRHYATSRKVSGSVPDEIIGSFNWSNPSSRIMTLGSTQPLTELSTRNLPEGQRATGA